MNRIKTYLQNSNGRKLLIPFFTAGFPSWKKSLDLISTAIDSGADFVEIGVPFSDPLADGPEIQYSSFAALKNGVSLKKILSGVESIRKKSNIPLILMGYYNPILTYGENKFMSDAKNAGVDGLIIPDLSIDEAAAYSNEARKNHISTIFLAAPTSTDNRIKLIEKLSTDFVYAVTVTGVTGAGKVFGPETDNYLKHLRRILKKKFVAGFGVSSADSARRLARFSDGIVIGSKLVTIIRKSKNDRKAVRSVGELLTSIRKAI